MLTNSLLNPLVVAISLRIHGRNRNGRRIKVAYFPQNVSILPLEAYQKPKIQCGIFHQNVSIWELETLAKTVKPQKQAMLQSRSYNEVSFFHFCHIYLTCYLRYVSIKVFSFFAYSEGE